MRTATQVRFINLEKNLMGFFKDLITFGGYSQSKATAKAAQDQARQQEELYNQQLKEQQEAAILRVAKWQKPLLLSTLMAGVLMRMIRSLRERSVLISDLVIRWGLCNGKG